MQIAARGVENLCAPRHKFILSPHIHICFSSLRSAERRKNLFEGILCQCCTKKSRVLGSARSLSLEATSAASQCEGCLPDAVRTQRSLSIILYNTPRRVGRERQNYTCSIDCILTGVIRRLHICIFLLIVRYDCRFMILFFSIDALKIIN
jgi:hypothetical protein